MVAQSVQLHNQSKQMVGTNCQANRSQVNMKGQLQKTLATPYFGSGPLSGANDTNDPSAGETKMAEVPSDDGECFTAASAAAAAQISSVREANEAHVPSAAATKMPEVTPLLGPSNAAEPPPPPPGAMDLPPMTGAGLPPPSEEGLPLAPPPDGAVGPLPPQLMTGQASAGLPPPPPECLALAPDALSPSPRPAACRPPPPGSEPLPPPPEAVPPPPPLSPESLLRNEAGSAARRMLLSLTRLLLFTATWKVRKERDIGHGDTVGLNDRP